MSSRQHKVYLEVFLSQSFLSDRQHQGHVDVFGLSVSVVASHGHDLVLGEAFHLSEEVPGESHNETTLTVTNNKQHQIF